MTTENEFTIALNTVRQTWVAIVSPELKRRIIELPREERFALYHKIDSDILAERTRIVNESLSTQKVNRDSALKEAAKTVIDKLNDSAL